jgi:hypothetical protein
MPLGLVWHFLSVNIVISDVQKIYRIIFAKFKNDTKSKVYRESPSPNKPSMQFMSLERLIEWVFFENLHFLFR